MRRQFPGVAIVAASALAVFIGAANAQDAGNYEAPPVTSPASIIPKAMLQGPGWKVQGKALGDGMLYTYTLWTPFGIERPGSTDMLYVKIGEARAMQELARMEQDPLFAEGMHDAVEAGVNTVATAVRQPVRTLAEVPMGLLKFADSAALRVTEGKVTGESGGLLAAGTKRKLAADLQIDPYSENQTLQRMLNEVARNRNLGRLTVNISTMMVGGGTGTALSVVSLSTKARAALYSKTAPELQEAARSMLNAAGAGSSQVERFLKNPAFTVTRRYAIASAMDSLKGVRGIGNYIERVQGAAGPDMALYYQRQIELAEAYNANVKPLATVEFVTGTPVYTDIDGKKLIFAPIDILYWNSDLALRLDAFKKLGPDTKVELWITGTGTEKAKSMLDEAKVTVKEKALSSLLK